MNTIYWTIKAAKQLRKIDQQHQINIQNGVKTLAAMPNCNNVRHMHSYKYGYRLSVGNYRVLFDWDNHIKVIQIEEVRKRDERTY